MGLDRSSGLGIQAREPAALRCDREDQRPGSGQRRVEVRKPRFVGHRAEQPADLQEVLLVERLQVRVDQPLHAFVAVLSLFDHQAEQLRMRGGESNVFTNPLARPLSRVLELERCEPFTEAGAQLFEDLIRGRAP